MTTHEEITMLRVAEAKLRKYGKKQIAPVAHVLEYNS